MTAIATPPKPSLSDAVSALEAENARLRSQLNEQWSEVSRLHSVERDARKDRERCLELERKVSSLIGEVQHWKRTVRFEQAPKAPRKQVRHLPLYNSVKRAALRDAQQWFGSSVNAERIYLREWRDENRRKPGLNGGRGLLEILMNEIGNDGAAPISQRDATVAATVIQWLGTKCGQSFMFECERQIKELRERERKARQLKGTP